MSQNPQINAWQQLQKQTKNGLLQFDPADALTGATACQELIDDLIGMKDAIENLGLTTMPVIASAGSEQVLASGATLTNVYNTKAAHLRDVLSDQIQIITMMGDTFVAAGKKYQSTDSASADSISALEGVSMPTTPTAYQENLNAGGVPSATLAEPSGGKFQRDFPGDDTPRYEGGDAYTVPQFLTSFGAKDATVRVDIEPKDSLDMKEMHKLYLHLDPASIIARARSWYALALTLTERLNDMVGAILPLNESWIGTGGQAAQKAVTDYQASGDDRDEHESPVHRAVGGLHQDLHAAGSRPRDLLPRQGHPALPGRVAAALRRRHEEHRREHARDPRRARHARQPDLRAARGRHRGR